MSRARRSNRRRYHAGDEVEPMTARPRTPGSVAATAAMPAALNAFLRGVERRAALFADLQCGDPSLAEAALEASLHKFVAVATRHPVADWPQRYWSLLLAAPALRSQAEGARWPAAFAHLAGLGRGPRAALLLSLVARLPEPDAAAVLGTTQPTYRLALQRALPAATDGQSEADTWHALDQAGRDALQALPIARLQRLAQLRDAMLSGRRLTPDKPAPGPRWSAGLAQPHPAPPRWLLPLLWAALALCVAGLVASFLLPDAMIGRGGNGSLTTRTSPLPAASPPSARFDSDMGRLSHPDFEQLAHTDDAAVIGALDFYAWYAANLETQPAAPLALPDADQPLQHEGEEAATEDADAPR